MAKLGSIKVTIDNINFQEWVKEVIALAKKFEQQKIIKQMDRIRNDKKPYYFQRL